MPMSENKEEIKNERLIPVKNYIIVGVILLAIVLLVWYGMAWYKVYKEEKVSTSYLIKNNIISKEINDIKEINDVFSEVSDEYFVYISYTGNEEIYEMEKGLAKIIKKYDISEDFYYINVNDMKDKEGYIEDLNKALGLKDNKIINIPTIIYFQDGEVLKNNIINRNDDKMMTANDFQKLLDLNKIEK